MPHLAGPLRSSFSGDDHKVTRSVNSFTQETQGSQLLNSQHTYWESHPFLSLQVDILKSCLLVLKRQHLFLIWML